MRLTLTALLVAAACGPAATSPLAVPSGPTGSPHGMASHTPVPVNVDDMMGGPIPDATVFTLARGEVHAVTLLNHFVRYRIAVAGGPHAVVSPDGERLYVADRTVGATRLRAFDVRTGAEVASTTLAEELADDRALAMAANDRLFVLLKGSSSDDGRATPGAGVRVEEYGRSLAPAGDVAKAECAERLLVSEGRIALVCGAIGAVVVHTLVGEQAPFAVGPSIIIPGAPIVASTMLIDGTIVLGSRSGALSRVPAGSTKLVVAANLGEGSILPDGIAPADGGFVVFTRSGDGNKVTVHEPHAGVQIAGPFRVDVRGPHVVALGSFAYFAGDGGIWHVDLRTGLLERMLILAGPVPLAVSSR